jgi:thymidylate synthase ThyX
MIEVKIIADSISNSGVRLTTFVLKYPRFFHSEFMTHRVMSRNASSSRAIPLHKEIEEVVNNPAIPLSFLKNKPGMQGGDPLEDQQSAVNLWLEARDKAVECAKKMQDMNIHKQFANRILEPFTHISVVVTATDYINFFGLRYHQDAQPEILELAKKMYQAYNANTPDKLNDGEWHLPFITNKDWEEAKATCTNQNEALQQVLKRSAARCARVSYRNHDGTNTTLAQDLTLYDRLINSTPAHCSPVEHQAMACSDPNIRSGNFKGWVQYRQGIKGQNIVSFKA